MHSKLWNQQNIILQLLPTISEITNEQEGTFGSGAFPTCPICGCGGKDPITEGRDA